MAHKTLIGGTAYEISGGRTLINGTAYSIKNGKTLAGGTAYEVGFTETVDVYITLNKALVGTIVIDAAHAYATINDITYDGSATVVLSVPVGTEVEVYASGNVILNGEALGKIVYKHIIQKQTTITIGAQKIMGTYGYTNIIDAAPVVFAAGFFYAWCDAGSTWNDLNGHSISSTFNVVVDGGVVYANTDKTTKVQLNGVDVKPTDLVEHLAAYTSIAV